jgi:hypothetical protein
VGRSPAKTIWKSQLFREMHKSMVILYCMTPKFIARQNESTHSRRHVIY